jgi:hypothetical protein
MRAAPLCLLLGLCACTSDQKQSAAPSPPEPVVEAPPPDAAVPAPVPVPPAEPPPGRALTAGEIAMVLPFFAASIDYAQVRVVPERYFLLQPADTYMTPNGNIYAPGPLFQADFSLPVVDASIRAIFVHEMTHVWQHQSGINLIVGGVVEFLRQGGDYGKAYPYLLAAGRDLLDYGLEQQAALIEDQARMTFGRAPWRVANPNLSTAQRDALYAEVLRSFRADPGYAHKLTPEQLHARVGSADRRSFDHQ